MCNQPVLIPQGRKSLKRDSHVSFILLLTPTAMNFAAQEYQRTPRESRMLTLFCKAGPERLAGGARAPEGGGGVPADAAAGS